MAGPAIRSAARRSSPISETRPAPTRAAPKGSQTTTADAWAGTQDKKSAPLDSFVVTTQSIKASLADGSYREAAPDLSPAHARLLSQAYGKDGALGPMSPAGKYGPIGESLFNPSTAMRFLGSIYGPWIERADRMGKAGGPTSPFGPLGFIGAMSDEAYHAIVERTIEAAPLGQRKTLRELFRQLEPGGLFGFLGRAGIYGAASAYGLAGPTGGTGHVMNDKGEFIGAKGVERSVELRFDGDTKRDYRLFEAYSEDRAKEGSDDSFFMVPGRIEARDRESGDTFSFKVKADQVVSLVAVPGDLENGFGVELLSKDGTVLARSADKEWINGIQFEAKKGMELKVRVKLIDQDSAEDSWLRHPVAKSVEAVLFPHVLFWESLRPWAAAAGIETKSLFDENTYHLHVAGSTAH